VKLAAGAVEARYGRTFYILERADDGLHFEDVAHVDERAASPVDRGNTVLVIEHNLDVIRPPIGSSIWAPRADLAWR